MTDTMTPRGEPETTSAPYLVVSSDGHAGPSLERSLRPYCPNGYLEQFDEYVRALRDGEFFRHERDNEITHVDRILMTAKPSRDAEDRSAVEREAWERVQTCPGHDDPHARLQDMDATGIAAGLIFAGGQNDEYLPFMGSGLDAGHPSTDPKLRAVGDEIWNRWLADFVSVAPERLLGVMQIPIFDVDEAVRTVERGREAGLRAVNFPSPRSDFPAYNDPRYEPFWSACEAAQVALVTHSGGGECPLGFLDEAGRSLPGGFRLYRYERHWLCRRSLWQLIFGGVFERHPDLHIVYTEQNTAWVPPTLRDLDNLYDSDQQNAAFMDDRSTISELAPKRPSEYWTSNCFNGGSFLGRHEAAIRQEVGRTNLLWGDDYPHQEGTWPHTMLALRHTFAGIPEDDVRLILGENALRAYFLDESILRPVAERIGPRPKAVDQPLDPADIPLDRGFAFRTYENF